MTASDQARFGAPRLKTGLLGLIGTAASSFVLGVVVFGVLTGGKLTLSPMVVVLSFGYFAAETVVGYLMGLLPLWYVARVRKASHAFWLAVAASLFSLALRMTGTYRQMADHLAFPNHEEFVLAALVAVLHLAVFSVLCVLYRQLVGRSQHEH